jgi:hypothetical protein
MLWTVGKEISGLLSDAMAWFNRPQIKQPNPPQFALASFCRSGIVDFRLLALTPWFKAQKRVDMSYRLIIYT